MSTKILTNIPITKTLNNNEYTYFINGGLTNYMKEKYNIELYDEPNECVLVNDNGKYHLKIIEYKDYILKNKQKDDDYDYELKTGNFKIKEYNLMFQNYMNINISMCYVLSKRFEDKLNTNQYRYSIVENILKENNIKLINEYSDSIYEELQNWIFL